MDSFRVHAHITPPGTNGVLLVFVFSSLIRYGSLAKGNASLLDVRYIGFGHDDIRGPEDAQYRAAAFGLKHQRVHCT